MQDNTLWFSTLSGGQLGIHVDNCIVEEVEFTENLYVEILSTGETFDLRLCDNLSALYQYKRAVANHSG